MQTSDSHISIFTGLLPQYRLINSLHKQIVDNLKLSFESQCYITDFYNTFKDRMVFEKAVVNLLLSTDNEKLASIVTNLRGEIGRSIDIYVNNKVFFDGIDIIKVCSSRHNPFQAEIYGQLKDTNKLGKELTQVRNSLESASWNNDKTSIELLTREEEKIEGLYKKEQEKLNILYQQQKESDNHAAKYLENVFEKIYELGCSFISLLNSYFPVEKEKKPAELKPIPKPGVYFDMKLVSLIHNECNNIQFENLSELDLYAILNIQSANAKLTVKSGERTRMCFLIYKLYEYLKIDSRTEWRIAILEFAGIDKKYYDSKYKEPESEIPSRKSESFTQRINKIFEYIS